MKVYTVEGLYINDYDGSVWTEKFGAFVDRHLAIQNLKAAYQKIHIDYADEILKYSDEYEYKEECLGLLRMEEDFEVGYCCVSFGVGAEQRTISVAVEEWEIKDE